MSGFYTVAYAVGFRPWEQAGQEAAEHFGQLLDREAAERPSPPGRALDLGCGTGAHAIELARRGWEVTGVDNQSRALRAARRQAAERGARVRFLEADVTALPKAGIGAPVDFFLDVGCFHHLTEQGRRAMAGGVTALAAPDATLLLLAFAPGKRGPLPPGAGRDEVEQAFAGWKLIADEPAGISGMPRALRRSAPRWYRMRLS